MVYLNRRVEMKRADLPSETPLYLPYKRDKDGKIIVPHPTPALLQATRQTKTPLSTIIPGKQGREIQRENSRAGVARASEIVGAVLQVARLTEREMQGVPCVGVRCGYACTFLSRVRD